VFQSSFTTLAFHNAVVQKSMCCLHHKS